jgi:hypothetical protein
MTRGGRLARGGGGHVFDNSSHSSMLCLLETSARPSPFLHRAPAAPLPLPRFHPSLQTPQGTLNGASRKPTLS